MKHFILSLFLVGSFSILSAQDVRNTPKANEEKSVIQKPVQPNVKPMVIKPVQEGNRTLPTPAPKQKSRDQLIREQKEAALKNRTEQKYQPITETK